MSSLLPLPAQTADPKALCSRLYTYRLSRESLRLSSELLSSFLASVFMYIILKTWAGHPIINILSVYFGSLIKNYSKTKDIIKGWFLCCNREFVWSGEIKCRWPKICLVCTSSYTLCRVCTSSIHFAEYDALQTFSLASVATLRTDNCAGQNTSKYWDMTFFHLNKRS